MSSASPTRADRIRQSVGIDATTLQANIAAPVRFLGFWTAVVLPFAYLPLLFNGLEGTQLTAFVVLVALHVLSIVLGHEYNS
jgi:hypothetical protein